MLFPEKNKHHGKPASNVNPIEDYKYKIKISKNSISNFYLKIINRLHNIIMTTL